MRNKIVLAACLATATAAFAAGPFDAMKGKVKEGQYETTMEMDMSGIPGMPKGMGTQKHTFTHCVTADDIEKGKVTKGGGRDGKSPENCEVKDFKMSGNTASYTMECKGGPDMTADAKMTFVENGYDMDMKMAMNQGGQVMNMNQKMKSRLVGPCTGKK
jgi:hypothetical protein